MQSGRLLRAIDPAVLVAVAAVSLFAALAIGGGAAPLAIKDPGPLVRYGLPLAQLIVQLGIAGTIGSLALAVFAIGPRFRIWDRTLDVAAASAGVWAVGGIVVTVLAFMSASGMTPSTPGFSSEFLLFVTQISLGQAWLTTTLLAAAITVFAIVARAHTAVFGVLVLAVVGVVPLAQQGHAANLNADHDATISALGLHLVFAALWLGGLATLAIVGPRLSGMRLADVVRRYSALALLSFCVVAVSGVQGALIRLGSLANLATPYGELVLVKAGALIALGLAGVLQRRRLVARLGSAAARPFWTLVVGELVVMGVAIGFAAALSVTAPPTSDQLAPRDTPAEILTGRPLPAPFTAFSLVTTWRVDLIWAIVCALMLIGYWGGVVRLRRRGDAWPLHRPILWTLGVIVLVLLTSGGLNVYQEYLFSAHMLMHMALTMVVPLLLVPAAPVTLAMRAIVRRTDGSRGGREWLLLFVHSRWGRFIANPIVAAVLFAGSLVAFYYSPVFSWATTDHIGHEWMTVHFLITGYLFVQSLIGVDPGPNRLAYPLRLVTLLATMAFHAFFGLALMNGTGLLLADWYGAMGWGTSALADQQTAGGIAWGVGEIPTVVLAIVVATTWARSDERESRRLDRASERSGEADIAAYNEMLGKLGRH